MYYIHPDHLGSLHFITNASGSTVQELSFDACLSTGAIAKVEGRQRNPADWSYTASASPKFDRGYTFHEHMSDFDLINMNGRVYDPVIARFLSPDPMLQSPGNLQNYNRYSYVFNNPLKYTDPSGYVSRQHLSAGDAELINELDNLFPPGSSGSYAAACESYWNEFNTMLNFMGAEGNSNSPYQYNYATGQYINKTGQSVNFSSVFNNYILPNAAKPTPEQMAKLGWHEIGTDALGSRAYIIDGEIGAYVVLPFWAISGSYYNAAYYWGGIAAYGGDANDSKWAVNGGGYWSSLNWSEIGSSAVGLGIGVLEIIAGSGGTVFTGGLSTAIIIDGVARAGSNGAKLILLFSGKTEAGIATPTNLGGWAGKGLDAMFGASYNEISYGQGIGSFAYDAGVFTLMGANAANLAKVQNYPTAYNYINYSVTLPGVPYTAASDALNFRNSINGK